ncbi:Gfo/Idh/MocA family oxidoreductase [uncultured Eudoraea sp.]|uniref:Gfo/Idh/MocA family protein n=1 Tax=uncultured Eudoraea sp. TaxID=1035614 RepID=UPI0026175E1B|nr:Gfo/Idh/MocA family oxidoreductase [uncultured Eudoraea sp.]
MVRYLLTFTFVLAFSVLIAQGSNANELKMIEVSGFKSGIQSKTLKVGVIGLVHTHMHWILGRENRGDIEIVGIVEPNRDLAGKYARQHGFSMDIVYETMEEMIEETKPEAVTAFNTIYDHLKVVEYCAPKGIHIMVEKPLAVNWKHAKRMIELAKKHNVYLLTNYETSWYASNHAAYDSVYNSKKIGEIRKIVFHTGHQGPIEIGCNPEFLEWLTDPVLNGGGALTDFGCYGANLVTWLMKGIEPISVSCTLQQIKPHLYPKVEDEATVVLTYPGAQVIIQASWNWPQNVKDMEIYSNSGYIFCKNSVDMEILAKGNKQSTKVKAIPLPKSLNDPFALMQQLVKEGYVLPPFSPSSIENNAIVIQILEAAKISAKNGSTVFWNDFMKTIE